MRNVGSGNPLVVQWLGLSFHCRGHGFNSILGRGSKILQATHGGTQKQKDGCSIAWHPQPPSPIDSLSSDFLGTCKNSHHVAPRPLAEEMLGHHNLITSWTSFAQLWKYYISNYEFCMAHLQKKLFCWCAEESQPHEGRSKEASQAKFQIWRVLGWDSVLPLASVRVCVCVCSVMPDSLQHHGLWPTRLFCPWNSPGDNTGVGCHFLLQGLFPTQGLNPLLLHWRVDSLPLSRLGRTKTLVPQEN